MENWKSCRDWSNSYEQKPDLNYFKNIIDVSEHMVPVSNCSKKYFNSQERCIMSFENFLKHWNETESSRSSKLYYLKDWHFFKEVPDYKAYQTPYYFTSDWLNEYLEDSDQDLNIAQDFHKSDYKFVYIGPKGSWTPFHSDVFGSYSWSANVIGEKEWIFFPPGYEKLLLEKSSGEIVYDIYDVLPCDESDLFNRQSFLYQGQEIVYYRIRQKRNEIVFVPSEWYHQVKNIESTISINHNWFNATNVMTIWNILQNELKNVEAEISDCKAGCKNEEWNHMCQKLLRSSHGMNVEDFIHLCTYIAKKRISSLKNIICSSKPQYFGRNHMLYDLSTLRRIFTTIEDTLFLRVNKGEIINSIDTVLHMSLNRK